MIVTTSTSVQEILDARPDALTVFQKHGVDVPSECPDCILDSELELCESMCHIEDLPALVADLQKFFDAGE